MPLAACRLLHGVCCMLRDYLAPSNASPWFVHDQIDFAAIGAEERPVRVLRAAAKMENSHAPSRSLAFGDVAFDQHHALNTGLHLDGKLPIRASDRPFGQYTSALDLRESESRNVESVALHQVKRCDGWRDRL